MIEIQQDKPEIDGLEQLINKNAEVSIHIDTDAVSNDIVALKNKLNSPKSKIDKQNLNNLIEYLAKLQHKVKDGQIEMLWTLNNYVLSTYPIELKHIPEYNIEMTDYITVPDGHLVRINYTDVFNIIALEMMYRDLGETRESMEEYLEDIGITGIYASSELLKHFEENVYMLGKTFRIEDSPYYASDIKKSFEYFGKESFKSKYYKDCIDFSFKHAISIITLNILNKLAVSNLKFQLCSASTSGIYFTITGDSDIDIDKLFNDSAVVRAFGRKFEVKPKITVF